MLALRFGGASECECSRADIGFRISPQRVAADPCCFKRPPLGRRTDPDIVDGPSNDNERKERERNPNVTASFPFPTRSLFRAAAIGIDLGRSGPLHRETVLLSAKSGCEIHA